MLFTLLKSKIHRATVTQTEMDYVGSLSIDTNLMEASGILEYEKILVANLNTGLRFETYCIKGGKGAICVNGAAARLATKGDELIIMAFCNLNAEEAKTHKPKIVFVDKSNTLLSLSEAEEQGSSAKFS
jgi:aspartate 1-decarboxylase